jgi:hypothetical protein
MRNPAVVLLLAALVGAPAAVRAQTSPFVGPPFAGQCVVHHFEEAEAPPLDACTDDPLCVEYEKRDITGTNGGAIRFLAAEPARFAIAIPKCRYWQQDHWRVQLSPGDPTIIQWDGSYWFDKGNATGGAELGNFSIGGQPASPGQLADLIAPLDPDLATVIRTYGNGQGGGGGSTFELPASDPTCAASPDGNACYDSVAMSRTRATADARCDCATAEFHGRYIHCVKDVVAEDVAAGRLAAECGALLAKCAKRSVCGRPSGGVVCFRTTSRGAKKCGIRRDPGSCRAPVGGTSYLGTGTSCCDPGEVDGCS